MVWTWSFFEAHQTNREATCSSVTTFVIVLKPGSTDTAKSQPTFVQKWNMIEQTTCTEIPGPSNKSFPAQPSGKPKMNDLAPRIPARLKQSTWYADMKNYAGDLLSVDEKSPSVNQRKNPKTIMYCWSR